MRYLVQERLFSFTTDFWIEDEDGNQVFLVDGSGPFSREAFTLRDADGNLLTFIRRKLFSWRETLQIESEGGELASVHAAFSFFRPRYEISLTDGGQLEATGNFTGKDFEILGLNGEVYGSISRERFRLRDSYWVDVPPGLDPPLIISIAVAIDRIHADAERERR